MLFCDKLTVYYLWYAWTNFSTRTSRREIWRKKENWLLRRFKL